MSQAFAKLQRRVLSERVMAMAEADLTVVSGAVVVTTARSPLGATVRSMFAGKPRSL